jgi:hypothetical protein
VAEASVTVTISYTIGNEANYDKTLAECRDPSMVCYAAGGVVYGFRVPDFDGVAAYEFFVRAGHSEPLAAAFRDAGYPAEAGNGTSVFHRINAGGASVPAGAERLVVQPRKTSGRPMRKTGKGDQGRDDDYPGGSVWRTPIGAETAALASELSGGPRYAVYVLELPGTWDECTY